MEASNVNHSLPQCELHKYISYTYSINAWNYDHPHLEQACLNCPYPDCKLDEETSDVFSHPVNGDILVQCMFCTTMEEVGITNGYIDRNRRFIQDGTLTVWHLKMDLTQCGECRIIG